MKFFLPELSRVDTSFLSQVAHKLPGFMKSLTCLDFFPVQRRHTYQEFAPKTIYLDEGFCNPLKVSLLEKREI